MRKFLKIAAVVMLTFAGYYLLLGAAMLMSSGEIGELAQSTDSAIDAGMATQATIFMGVLMLINGIVQCVTGVFALLGNKHRGLLIASVVLAGLMLAVVCVTVFGSEFNPMYLLELLGPVLVLIAGIGVLRAGPEEAVPTLKR